ncbi:hypothetical protein BDZ91DRAFT_457469 [Kalaharituber pfeilii]|nr:hypothetical protein BDZ91DRAFT_457469 [Kalaharituber pfeilii]
MLLTLQDSRMPKMRRRRSITLTTNLAKPTFRPHQPDSRTKFFVNLWVEAHESLPEENKRILVECGIIINAKSSQTGFLDEILRVAKEAKEKAEAKSGKFKFGSMEIDLGQKMQAIICWIDKFKTIGDIVIQYDPVHAALPWAGVRFILQMIVDRQESTEAALIGMDRITMLISQGTIYEQLYLTIEEPPMQGRDARNTLYRALIKLYAAILTSLSILMRHFTSNIDIF